MDIPTILKLLSDENRLRIMNILKESPLCVGEIQTLLNIKQSNASSHLEKLKSYGLITNTKKAQWIYYQICFEKIEEYSFIKQLIFEDIKTSSIFQEDLFRLNKYKSSGLNCQDLKNVDFDFSKIKF
ncbi:MAG: metalloregulator ArsR/SmtB family transcription factor [Sphaerochaetaceae bacterium]